MVPTLMYLYSQVLGLRGCSASGLARRPGSILLHGPVSGPSNKGVKTCHTESSFLSLVESLAPVLVGSVSLSLVEPLPPVDLIVN